MTGEHPKTERAAMHRVVAAQLGVHRIRICRPRRVEGIPHQRARLGRFVTHGPHHLVHLLDATDNPLWERRDIVRSGISALHRHHATDGSVTAPRGRWPRSGRSSQRARPLSLARRARRARDVTTPRRGEMARDHHTLSGWEPTQRIGGRQSFVVGRVGGRRPSRASVVMARTPISASPIKVLACSRVPGSASPERKTFTRWLLTTLAERRPVARLHLGQVLKDGDELDAMARRGGRQRIQLGQWSDVGGFVEHHQEGRVKGRTQLGGPFVGRFDDARDQGGEQRTQTALIVGRRAQVEGVPRIEEPGRLDDGVVERSVTGPRPGTSADAATSGSAKASTTVSAVVYTALRCLSSRSQLALTACNASRASKTSSTSDTSSISWLIDPAHDVGHRPARQRRRQHHRPEQLGGGGVPEVPVGQTTLKMTGPPPPTNGPRAVLLATSTPGRAGTRCRSAARMTTSGRTPRPRLQNAGSRWCGAPDRI